MKERKPVPLTRKVNALILLSLALGFGGIIAFLGNWLLTEIRGSARENLRQQSEILYKTIENFMMPGDAPRASGYFSDINAINPDYAIRLFRSDGSPAFRDDATLADVNRRLNFDKFPLRGSAPGGAAGPGSSPKPEKFALAVGMPPENVFFTEASGGRSYFRIYKPLINLPKCTGCHGGEHTIRGVVDIRNDVSSAARQQSIALAASLASFLLIVGALTALLTLYLRADIIRPVKAIGEVCSRVTSGDFGQRVKIRNRDEIGVLGATVNTMVEGLRERYELSKFVSSSTLRSLLSDQRGRKVMLTLFFSDVRGFTAYSEGRAPEEIVERLNGLLSFQTEIIQSEGGDVDKYVGDEVVAIFSGDAGPEAACRAAVRIQRGVSERQEDFGGLSVGVGVNRGEVILGMVGSQKRADYTVIGDAVNTASRFCGAAKAGQAIISESVREMAGASVSAEGPFRLSVKGKLQPLRVYLLKGMA